MKLSVLQWNVWFQESADNVLRLIEETDADIVCLQELTQDSIHNPDKDIPAAIETLGYSHVYLPMHQRTGEKHIKMGNGIFSKLPVISSRHIYVQHEDPGSDNYSRENRVYIEAKIKVATEILTVGTVHLSYVPEFAIDEAKRTEVDTLLSAISDNSENFVLTGDFNSMPDSYTISELSKFLRSAGPDYGRSTWTTKPFSHNGFEAKTLDWRLDYVFTTPDIDVVESKILQTDYSDHLPILTMIEF